jgi:hypothetical protein
MKTHSSERVGAELKSESGTSRVRSVAAASLDAGSAESHRLSGRAEIRRRPPTNPTPNPYTPELVARVERAGVVAPGGQVRHRSGVRGPPQRHVARRHLPRRIAHGAIVPVPQLPLRAQSEAPG